MRKEVVYNEFQKTYGAYLRSKGLGKTLQQFQKELGEIETDITIKCI